MPALVLIALTNACPLVKSAVARSVGASAQRVEVMVWCERRDSNPHAVRRWNLNPVRLPIPPLSPSCCLKRAFYRNLPLPVRRQQLYCCHSAHESSCFTNIIFTGNSTGDPRFVPVDHYENFPVASWLLPAPPATAGRVIYAFARSADDFADEGDLARCRTARIARRV